MNLCLNIYIYLASNVKKYLISHQVFISDLKWSAKNCIPTLINGLSFPIQCSFFLLLLSIQPTLWTIKMIFWWHLVAHNGTSLRHLFLQLTKILGNHLQWRIRVLLPGILNALEQILCQCNTLQMKVSHWIF